MPTLLRTGELANEYATILIYAPARWGKTKLVETLVGLDGGLPLVVATELGDTMGLQTIKEANVPFIPVENDKQLLMVAKELCKNPDKIEYPGLSEKITSVVVDSYTQASELWYEGALKIYGWSDLATPGQGKDTRQAYNYIAEKGRQTYKLFTKTPAHLVFICRQGQAEEGDGKERRVYPVPELQGQKLPREMPGWPDATLRGVITNGVRYFRTQTEMSSPAGIRVPKSFQGKVPRDIVPDMEAIIKVLLGDAAYLPRLAPKAPSAPAPAAVART